MIFEQGGEIQRIRHEYDYEFDSPEYLQCAVWCGTAENLHGTVQGIALYSCLATL